MSIEEKIGKIADEYAVNLKVRINQRIEEMKTDDKSHYLIYRILGVTLQEGDLIDVYQNKGRFLYNYAGSFLQEATKLCLLERYPESGSVRIPNTLARRPKNFEIDCLVENRDAIEIKWRDATTDGDHITKEHTRMQNIKEAGYKPIRIMFYYPNRQQAQRIQSTLETLYAGVGGEYHYGEGAWTFVKEYATVDLKQILEKIADQRITNE